MTTDPHAPGYPGHVPPRPMPAPSPQPAAPSAGVEAAEDAPPPRPLWLPRRAAVGAEATAALHRSRSAAVHAESAAYMAGARGGRLLGFVWGMAAGAVLAAAVITWTSK